MDKNCENAFSEMKKIKYESSKAFIKQLNLEIAKLGLRIPENFKGKKIIGKGD